MTYRCVLALGVLCSLALVPVSATTKTTDSNRFEKLNALADQQISVVADISGAMLIGASGVGKSTLVSVQDGTNYGRPTTGGSPEIIFKAGVTPKTSSGFSSETLQVSVWKPKYSKVPLVDTPGVGDNREHFKDIADANLYYALKMAKKVDALVIVLSYDMFSLRGKNLRSFLDDFLPYLRVDSDDAADTSSPSSASFGAAAANGTNASGELYGDNSFVYNSTIMVVTHTPPGLTEEQLRDISKGFLTNEETTYDEKISRLMKAFPLDLLTIAAAVAKKGGLLTNEESVDWAAVSQTEPHSIEELEKKRGVMKFLERLTVAPLVISSLQDAEACEKQRHDFNTALGQVTPLSTQQLQRMGTHASASVNRYQRDLASVAAFLSETVSPYATSLAALKETLHANAPLVQAIDNNPEAARPRLVKDLEETSRELTKKIETEETRIEYLRTSTALVPDGSYRVSKGCPYKWWWFFGEHRDYGQAEFTQSYTAGATIRAISIDYGGDDVETHQPKYHSHTGSSYFKGHKGRNLDLKFTVKVFEKEHPQTAEQIARSRRKLQGLQEDKKKVKADILFVSATNKSGLIQFVVEGKKVLEERLSHLRKTGMDVFIKAASPANDLPTKYQEQSVHGLAALLKSLQVKKLLLLDDLAPVEVKSINEFLESYDLMQSVKRDALVVAYISDATALYTRAPPAAETDRSTVNAATAAGYYYTYWVSSLPAALGGLIGAVTLYGLHQSRQARAVQPAPSPPSPPAALSAPEQRQSSSGTGNSNSGSILVSRAKLAELIRRVRTLERIVQAAPTTGGQPPPPYSEDQNGGATTHSRPSSATTSSIKSDTATDDDDDADMTHLLKDLEIVEE